MFGGLLAVLLPCDRYRLHAAVFCMLRPCVKCAESSAGWSSVFSSYMIVADDRAEQYTSIVVTCAFRDRRSQTTKLYVA